MAALTGNLAARQRRQLQALRDTQHETTELLDHLLHQRVGINRLFSQALTLSTKTRGSLGRGFLFRLDTRVGHSTTFDPACGLRAFSL